MIVAVACIAVAPGRPLAADDGRGDVAFAGRVVELATRRPIAGAEVVVTRIVPGEAPPWSWDEALATAADGRFALRFSPEDRSRAGLEISLWVDHPGFVARRSRAVALADLMAWTGSGDVPFFASVVMEPGREIGGRLLRPDAAPAGGVPYQVECWSAANVSEWFYDDPRGRTDRDGRVRAWVPKASGVVLRATPEDAAPFEKRWEAEGSPVPTDLGTMRLDAGLALSGRVSGLKGEPVAGVRVEAQLRGGRDRRLAVSKEDGTFAFPPMRPGSYTVGAAGQIGSNADEPGERTFPESRRAFRPLKVNLRRESSRPVVVVREVETVAAPVRFVTADGRPFPGARAGASGQFVEVAPVGMMAAEERPGGAAVAKGGAAGVEHDPDEDESEVLPWSLRLDPDAEGRVAFRVPKGLLDGYVGANPFEEGIVFRSRPGPGEPLRPWAQLRLGAIRADVPEFEVVAYRSPTIFARVARADGEALGEEEVQMLARWRDGNTARSAGRFVRQADGCLRGSRLFPDQEIEVATHIFGFAVATERLVLPEGATREIVLRVDKLAPPAKVGELAPPIVLRGIDGTPVSLLDLRGRHVLVTFWVASQFQAAAPKLKAIRGRSDGDRLAMLGVCFDLQAERVAESAEANGVRWPQALAANSQYRLREAYGLSGLPSSVLIGPDGAIVASGLSGDAVARAVDEALGNR